MRTLDERGLADDTLVVVIADHGEGLTDGKQRHGWTGHRVLYQEQMRVPLLLRVPDGPRGHVVPELARAIDLYPTVLDYLDLPAPRPVAGTSLRALIEGEPDEPRLAYAEQINRFDLNAGQLLRRRPQADLLHCVSDGEWKLIYRPSYPEESELYRLSDDPGEERNLWAEAHDHRRRLLSELARHAGWVLEPLQGAGGTLSPLAQEILEDLGYAGDAEQPSSSDSGWSWFCPGDDVRREEAGSCPSCGAPTVPRARD